MPNLKLLKPYQLLYNGSILVTVIDEKTERILESPAPVFRKKYFCTYSIDGKPVSRWLWRYLTTLDGKPV